MSYKTCPDWPELMELAPDLQFKHVTARDVNLQFDIVARLPQAPLEELEICCDMTHHVFNASHTHPGVAAALAGTHWFEVHEWATSGPGSGAHAA